MAEKSKILIIGATGYIGKYLVGASVKAGHPTYALVRESSISSPVKLQRFLPSEFGPDTEFAGLAEPAASLFRQKSSIRKAIEKENIPFTYVVSYGFAGYFLANLGQDNCTSPPRDKVVIKGEGNAKIIVVKEEDIAEYTINAADDPRTLNKILDMRLPQNELSFNEIVSLWENKIGKTLEKTYLLEEQLLQKIKESPYPYNLYSAIFHSIFVKGVHGPNVDASIGVEASQLYPEVKYTTVSEYLDQFL